MYAPPSFLKDENPAATFPSLENAQISDLPKFPNINVLTFVFMLQFFPECIVALDWEEEGKAPDGPVKS